MTADSARFRSLPLAPLLERAFEGIAMAAPNPWRLVFANEALAAWLGTSAGALLYRPVSELFQSASDLAFDKTLGSVWKEEGQEAAFSANLMVPGEPEPVDIRLVRVVVDHEPFVAVLVQKKTPEWKERTSVPAGRKDPLTGLPDRAFLLSRLETLLRREGGADHPFSVLFVDLDNFKQVNDAYGHLVGDDVLREASRRLSDCLREVDCIVRYGGDEFVVILERADELQDVQPVMRRIHAALAQPISLPNGQVRLSASIGFAICAGNFDCAEEVLMAADRDMYASKRERQS